MANLAVLLKRCKSAVAKATKDGKVPRSWLCTAEFCRIIGKDKKELLDIPVLNSRITGSLRSGNTTTDVVLLCD